MTPAAFRLAFPEFENDGIYEDSAINSLLTLATARLKAELWDDSLDQGIGLFVAHYLILNKKQFTNNGATTAVITSKTVGPITISYDPSWSVTKNGGHWNLTGYGQQFIYLARMVGNCAPAQFYGAY
jgi:hypothetical protein